MTPPKSTHTRYASHWFMPEWLINCHEIRAPNAPTAPKERLRTPVVLNSTIIPTPERA